MTQREAEALVGELLDAYFETLEPGVDEEDIITGLSASEYERFVYDWAERIRREAGLTEFRQAVAAIPRSEGDVA